MKTVWLIVAMSLSVSVSEASTVDLTGNNLAANGWKATATNVYGGSPNASVTNTSDYGSDNFKFFTGSMPVSWQFQWAGISSDAFAGLALSNITSIAIRNYGVYGDNVANWQPPTFTWVLDIGSSNQRSITWKPWSNGNSREAGVWHEYDAATTGQWFVEETATSYNSLAALQAALPNAHFEYSANLPLDWGYASQQAFNVGNCPLYDSDRAWFSGASGYVDWFEVGINGNVTRYNLSVIPEPTTFYLVAIALTACFSIRRVRLPGPTQ